MKILLISPFPPAQNPRLWKEYQTLKTSGYDVKVIYGSRDLWANGFENTNLDFILIGGKKGDFSYFITRIFFKILIKPFLKDFSVNAISYFQNQKAKSIKADLYIAHNLAALPIAVKAAMFHNAKCGFDAEDFHRQEVSDDVNSKDYKLAKYLEDKYLPQVDYLSAASHLITAEYKKLYPQLNPVTINNVFSFYDLVFENQKSKIKNQKLELFWFSQTIGKGRGIEDAILAIGSLNNKEISLTLLGNCSVEVKIYFEDLSQKMGMKESQLIFQAPMPPNEIFKICTNFDIGLAIEKNVPYNRDICLTNKIFTYLTSGLAVIVTDTLSQKRFLDENPAIGKTYQIGNYTQLAQILNFYYQNKDELTKAKVASLHLAKNKYNWEIESEKFLKIINSLY